MTDPYRTPPAGWKPEPFEGSSFLKREVPPSIFERMEKLLAAYNRDALRPPLAFALGPLALRDFYNGLRPGSFGEHVFHASERPTWNGVPVAFLVGFEAPNEVRLVR